MSRTLNLVHRLLAMGRKLQKLGANREAARVFGRLSGLRELPAAAAEEVQFRQGELLLRQRRYLRARRHLAAALASSPDRARYHFLMACAARLDDRCDPGRALEHYRRAAELAPERPRYLAAFGLAAVKAGNAGGLDTLRRAAGLAPDDAAVLRRAVEGLERCRHFDEAERLVRLARFRNPRDHRLRSLWEALRFRRARAEQLAERREAAAACADLGPTFLPFAPLPEGTPAGGGRKTFRLDPAAALPGPHATRHAGQRHA
jgi:tetratricopeptide (TPR) repeat protein